MKLKPDATSGAPDICGFMGSAKFSQKFRSFLLIAPRKNTVNKKVISRFVAHSILYKIAIADWWVTARFSAL